MYKSFCTFCSFHPFVRSIVYNHLQMRSINHFYTLHPYNSLVHPFCISFHTSFLLVSNAKQDFSIHTKISTDHESPKGE